VWKVYHLEPVDQIDPEVAVMAFVGVVQGAWNWAKHYLTLDDAVRAALMAGRVQAEEHHLYGCFGGHAASRWVNRVSEAVGRPLVLHWRLQLLVAAVRQPLLCYGPESLGNFYAMYFLQGHAGLREALQEHLFPVFHHHFRLVNRDIAGLHVLFEPACAF